MLCQAYTFIWNPFPSVRLHCPFHQLDQNFERFSSYTDEFSYFNLKLMLIVFQSKMSTATVTPDVTNPAAVLSATSVFYFLFLPALALWYAYWKISRKHMIELADKIPGPDGYPIIGSALEMLGTSSGKHNAIKVLNSWGDSKVIQNNVDGHSSLGVKTKSSYNTSVLSFVFVDIQGIPFLINPIEMITL